MGESALEKVSLLDRAMNDERTASILSVLRLKEEDYYNHSLEVGKLVTLCIEEMLNQKDCEWTEEECFEIVKGAVLHDIGRAFIPFDIQNSTMKLDEYTKEVVNIHPIVGYIVLREAGFSEIVKNIALLHHTSANGKGYPKNLETGEEYTQDNVPDYVWLISYADKFEAMTSHRKFRASKSYREAWNTINNMRIDGFLPYKFAKYMNSVVRELSIFGMSIDETFEKKENGE